MGAIAVVGAVVLARRPKGLLKPVSNISPSWAIRSDIHLPKVSTADFPDVDSDEEEITPEPESRP